MRICIVGLLPNQANEVAKTFQKTGFKFTFMLSEEAKRSRFEGTYDHIILMTKFISHTVQSKASLNSRPVLLNGGISILKTWLQKNLSF